MRSQFYICVIFIFLFNSCLQVETKSNYVNKHLSEGVAKMKSHLSGSLENYGDFQKGSKERIQKVIQSITYQDSIIIFGKDISIHFQNYFLENTMYENDAKFILKRDRLLREFELYKNSQDERLVTTLELLNLMFVIEDKFYIGGGELRIKPLLGDTIFLSANRIYNFPLAVWESRNLENEMENYVSYNENASIDSFTINTFNKKGKLLKRHVTKKVFNPVTRTKYPISDTILIKIE